MNIEVNSVFIFILILVIYNILLYHLISRYHNFNFTSSRDKDTSGVILAIQIFVSGLVLTLVVSEVLLKN